MAACGMLDFSLQPKIVNGIFGVPKVQDAIRLIIDCRPANGAFVEPPHVDLPTPDKFCELRMPSDKKLFVAKVDCDNFYHRLKLPVWLREYFGLPAVRAGDVGLGSKYGPDTLIHPCCATLPMGWSHSVYIAQAAHEHIINTRTSLSPSDRITSHTDARIDRVRHAIYIDDLILLGTDRAAVDRAQQEYLRMLPTIGLAAKKEKVVQATSEPVDCLGFVIDGSHHTIGVDPRQLNALCRETRTVLESTFCSGTRMAWLMGCWTWACLVNRPALAVFSAVYTFIREAGKRSFRIWNTVRRELTTVMSLCPLLYADIALPWSTVVIASDASTSGGQGVVAATVPTEVLEACADRRVPPTSSPAPTVAPIVRSADVSEQSQQRERIAFDPQLQRAPWRVIVRSPWRRAEPINVLEARAFLTGVRWALSKPSIAISHRLLLLTDSSVLMGAVTKGRSSSFPLLARLRSFTALILASGSRIVPGWIPTECNPADAASRNF
jgi:hypothetical protein